MTDDSGRVAFNRISIDRVGLLSEFVFFFRKKLRTHDYIKRSKIQKKKCIQS